MKRFIPLAVIAVVAAAVVLALARLNRRPPGAAAPGDTAAARSTVRVISPHHDRMMREYKRAFEQWHAARYGSDCTIVWEDRGGASSNMQFIQSEFKATPAGIGVDVFWGGGSAFYMDLAGKGLLEVCPVPDAVLAAIPSEVGGVRVYDPSFRWYGTALSSFGILYHRKRLEALKLPPPQTWEDLARPEYLGELAAADPRASSSAYTMVEVVLQACGWEKGFEVLTRMAGNTKRFEGSASAAVDCVSRQDVAAALAIDSYAAAAIRQQGRTVLGYTLPRDQTPITPDPIGILKGAPNLLGAQRLVEFALSEEGQRLLLLPAGAPGGPAEHDLLRIPVSRAVLEKYPEQSADVDKPSLFTTSFRYDMEREAARKGGLMDLYGAIFIDVAPELQAAWKGVIARGLKPDEVKRLCTPPVTEAELVAFSKQEWKDTIQRNRKIAEWATEALARYKALK